MDPTSPFLVSISSRALGLTSMRGRLSVGRGGIRVEREDGVVRELGHGSYRVEAGGFDGEFLFLRASDGWVATGKAEDLLDALEAVDAPALRSDLEAVRKARRGKSVVRWLGIAAVLVGIGLSIWAIVSVPAWVASSVTSLPPSIDEKLGEAAYAEVQSGGREVEHPAVRAVVEEILGRLEPHAPEPGFDFRVNVVESPEANAFALPGGQMVVYTGLLREAESGDEVAGVLAHEMAHVTGRHGLRNVAHRAGLLLGLELLLGDAEGWVALASEAALLAVSNDYSREQEGEADAEGARMLERAGIGTQGFERFFERMAGESGTSEALLAWVSTHPAHRERIAHVRAVAARTPSAPPRPLSASFDAAKRALGPADGEPSTATSNR